MDGQIKPYYMIKATNFHRSTGSYDLKARKLILVIIFLSNLMF